MTFSRIPRRSFVRNLSMATGATMTGSSLSLFDRRKQQRRLGVALVGLGNYSNTMLGPALKETEHCYLAGIVTGTPTKAEKWSEEYKIPASNIYNYDNYDDIANNDAIDIIYVVLPNSMHAEYSIRALEAGKHVICEKPMAMTAEEARSMIAAANKAQRKLAVGYRLHYDPFHQEAMRLGQSEAFGPINYMECTLGYSFTPDVNSWKVKKAMGGGSLYNLGVYPIQGARYTKGAEPVYVTGQATRKREDIFREIYEHFTWQLEFADGTLCNSYSGPGAYLDRLWAGCTDGFIELDPSYNYTGQVGRSTQGTMNYEHVFQQKLQMDDFAICVREDKPSRVDAMEGLKDALIIDAIYASISNNGTRTKIGTV